MTARGAGRLRVLGGVCASVVLWLPALIHWRASGFGDWQQFHHWWEIGVVSFRRWGEWPLWDPHHCGGVSQWGQPQAQNYGPLYLMFAVPFGTVVGHKLFLLVHTAIGWVGTYRLAREDEKMLPVGATLAATVWCASGFYAWHGAGGHSTFLAFYYAPWLLFAWRRAEHDYRYCAAVALLMTELLLEGGHYPFPFAAILLGFDLVCRLTPSRAGRLIVAGGISAVLTAFAGACRWVPILIAMSRYPRPIQDTDHLLPSEMLTMLTVREHDWRWVGHPWVWPEYGTYVGYGVLGLVALGLGLVLVRPRRRLHIVAGLALFLALVAGNWGPWWPAALLHHLPFVSNLHLPSRWMVYATLYLALLAGLPLSELTRALARYRRGRVTGFLLSLPAWLVALAIAVDLYTVALTITDKWDGPPLGEETPETPHLVASYDYLGEYAHFPQRNVGTMECYDAVPWPRSHALWLGEVPQARLAPRDDYHVAPAGSIDSYDRTNHTVTVDVTLAAAGRVVLNQNWEPEWRANTGSVVDDGLGRLAVDLPAGHHHLVVHFAPDDMPWSVLATLAGLLGCIALPITLTRRARRRRPTPTGSPRARDPEAAGVDPSP